ncbi:hypothetical protein RRG08_010382 [Elysia crispata]|uniref:Uncharacterized protein n=1 Tax=Elysia crispata TaxID=231223 RepID=A0AAE1BC39_9GAST|nr:hypothetical protein RRG08_010382 [Elysia crispata]
MSPSPLNRSVPADVLIESKPSKSIEKARGVLPTTGDNRGDQQEGTDYRKVASTRTQTQGLASDLHRLNKQERRKAILLTLKSSTPWLRPVAWDLGGDAFNVLSSASQTWCAGEVVVFYFYTVIKACGSWDLGGDAFNVLSSASQTWCAGEVVVFYFYTVIKACGSWFNAISVLKLRQITKHTGDIIIGYSFGGGIFQTGHDGGSKEVPTGVDVNYASLVDQRHDFGAHPG